MMGVHIISRDDFDDFEISSAIAGDTRTRKRMVFKFRPVDGIARYVVFRDGVSVEFHDFDEAIHAYNNGFVL